MEKIKDVKTKVNTKQKTKTNVQQLGKKLYET